MRSRWFRLIPVVAGAVVLAGLLWLIAPLLVQRMTVDGDWRLDAGILDGSSIPMVADHRPTLTIDGGRASGNAACNGYGAFIDFSGSATYLQDIFSTAALCLNDAQMTSEKAYLAALARVTRAQRDGERLLLTGPAVELRFSREAR